jgi:Flp pilus assembly protein TadB
MPRRKNNHGDAEKTTRNVMLIIIGVYAVIGLYLLFTGVWAGPFVMLFAFVVTFPGYIYEVLNRKNGKRAN